MTTPILPDATIGVLGGGQLGRMFSLAAHRMGYRVDVLAPDDEPPAGQVAYRHIRANYDDLDAVARFARSVSVVTFEFENVPSATAEAAARHAPVRPAGSLLHVTQDRVREKATLDQLGVPVAVHAVIDDEHDLVGAARRVGFPAILKTAAWGYDGKGQRRVDDAATLANAWDELGSSRAVLERLVPFEAEISVVGARGLDGRVALYEPVLNDHVDHVLDVTLCPAPVPDATRGDALAIARTVLEALDVVGVLCVEMFLIADGSLVVNELAPRPHNSGHLTIDAHACSQFEQQVRAVCGLPLGSTSRNVPAAAMANLLGDLWSHGPPNWPAALAIPGARLHLYGKSEPRPGRKMGHVTVLADAPRTAARLARQARDAVRREEAIWTGA